MKISSLVLFFVLFTSFNHGRCAHYLIHETCTKCAQTDPNINYMFCATSLEAGVPANVTINLTQLGMISMKLTKKNITDVKKNIKTMLKKKGLDSNVKSCLRDCFDQYSTAKSTLKDAIKDYKSKRYADANIKVSAVMEASTSCEDGFSELSVVSPLTKNNKDTFQLSAISLSIMNMLRLLPSHAPH